MEEEPGKQLPVRESKGSRKVTLTEKDKKAPSTLLTIKMIRNYLEHLTWQLQLIIFNI